MSDNGGQVVVRSRFSTTSFWDDVRRHGATTTTALIPILLRAAERPDDRANPLRVVFDGWATVDQAKRFHHRFGPVVISTYGSTEAGFPICNRDAYRSTDQHCGWLRRGYTARLVTDDGEDAGPGGAGELWLKPDVPAMIARGYLGTEDTAASFGEGWYRTRDRMLRNRGGAYVFTGRTTETLRRNGENVSPVLLEALLVEDPAIAEALVVGVASEVTGQDLVFVLVARRRELDPAALYGRLRAQLPGYMLPSYLVVVPGLPKLESGKVRRRGALSEDWRLTADHRPGSGRAQR